MVKEYERLIAQKRFPGEDAIAQIPEYERRQLAQAVYNGFYNASDEIPRPYPKNIDFYDAVPIIEEQLLDKAKAAEILTALTSRLDGLPENDRYFDSVRRAKERLSEYVDGTFSLFNHRHNTPQQEKVETPIEPKPVLQEIAPATEPEQPQTDESTAVLTPPKKKKQNALAYPLDADGRDYRITDDHIGEGAPLERFQRNLDAIAH